MRPKVWRNLDEIFAGAFDGMTYEEIQKVAPEEFDERARAKLKYRYPRGESYLDVIERLEPVVMELERTADPVLIVGLVLVSPFARAGNSPQSTQSIHQPSRYSPDPLRLLHGEIERASALRPHPA